jgi:LPPG:FO 2-phospho-L-lactate transferase
MTSTLKVVALAGGVGGAKMADGLAQVLPAENLTVIVNTGDDFEHLGLYLCPDLDTVCYTLAGIANPLTGWGRNAETWHALETLEQLGGESWFRLGDADLGLHLERTRRLRAGQKLSGITSSFCRSFGIQPQVLPVTDDRVPTLVQTESELLSFQEYFVHLRCEPVVRNFIFQDVDRAMPAPGVLESLNRADLIVICPSNPWVSIDPILAIPGLRQAIQNKPVIAISPIIGGKTVKGPAAKMYAELGFKPSAATVARHYRPLLRGFILDEQDAVQIAEVEAMNILCKPAQTHMVTIQDRKYLAEFVLETAQNWS